MNGIQQIGLILSKKFASMSDAFETISEHRNKITFEKFSKFMEESRALQGFNLTHSLMQQLFSHLDPHKKGYLTENDWKNAFQGYKWEDQCLSELKNLISCSFSDVEGAFQFFLGQKKGKGLSAQGRIFQKEFYQGVKSLSAKRFSDDDIKTLWKKCCTEGMNSVDQNGFKNMFDQMRFTGTSTLRSVKSLGKTTTGFSTFTMSSEWSNDIIQKLRFILKSTNISLREVFNKFDKDGSGKISQIEFRNSIRQLNLGLTSREIDQILNKVDLNADGCIDYHEFITKFTPK
jgi:Ca2+-binding EF-hand superfamily protein